MNGYPITWGLSLNLSSCRVSSTINKSLANIACPQKDVALGPSLIFNPWQDLNHSRSLSIMDTAAIGTLSNVVANLVSSSNRGSAGGAKRKGEGRGGGKG